MTRYSVEPRTRKYIKSYGYFSFGRTLSKKYGKQILDAATNTGLHHLNTATQKIVYKATEATGEVIGNKIADKIL